MRFGVYSPLRAAVTGVKIEGVNYEYATLKGVQSVLDMILNLKQLTTSKKGIVGQAARTKEPFTRGDIRC